MVREEGDTVVRKRWDNVWVNACQEISNTYVQAFVGFPDAGGGDITTRLSMRSMHRCSQSLTIVNLPYNHYELHGERPAEDSARG